MAHRLALDVSRSACDYMGLPTPSWVMATSCRIPPRLAGKRVLVVEDEDDARELVAHVLTKAGYVVSTASSAQEALERMHEVRPEVLVSDIAMPGEDGYSLMRHIRARDHAEGGDVPAIALTAFTSAADRSKAFKAGFTAHLPKPMRAADLLALLHTLTVCDADC